MWFFKIFFITYSIIFLIGSAPILGGQQGDGCEDLFKKVPSLILELSHPDPQVHDRAAIILAKISDPRTIAPQLISLIDAPNTSTETKEAALFSLRLILWKLPILDPANQEILGHITDCLRKHEKPEQLALAEENPPLLETPAADVPGHPAPLNEEDYIFQFIPPPHCVTDPLSSVCVAALITAAFSQSSPIPMREAAYFVLRLIKEVRKGPPLTLPLMTFSELRQQIDAAIQKYEQLDVIDFPQAEEYYSRALNPKYSLASRQERLRQLANLSFLYARELFLALHTFLIQNPSIYLSDDQAVITSIQDALQSKLRALPPYQRFIAREILAHTPPSTIMEMLYTDFYNKLNRPIFPWEKIMILISMREIPASLINTDFLNLIVTIYQNDPDEEVKRTARFMLRIISEEKINIQLSDDMAETIRKILYPRPSDGAKGK
ncbi:MAG: hypothetical protein HYY61_03070 [Deltaproteobacteria bacterium]|nr:hypothetical protein [Deltaproteobacteria bacterium]